MAQAEGGGVGTGLEQREIVWVLSHQKTHKPWSHSWKEGALLVEESEMKGSRMSMKHVV